MEKNLYNNRLPNQEEIKESLDRYFGFLHSKINTLASSDFSKIIDMKDKGWLLKSSKQEIEKLIEDFVNIYGYIYSNGQNTKYPRLVRGTTTKEATEMLEGKGIESILSTTTDENIAKRFCEYDKAALIRIKTADDLPKIYVDDLKGESSEEEKEVLILPFSKVKSAKLTSNLNGYKYYDVELEKEELPDIEEEKLDELKEDIIDGYENYEQQLQEYENLVYKYENENSFEVKDIIYKKISEISKSMHQYKSRMQELLKGLCKQREKDLLLEEQNQNKIKIEQVRKQEANRINRLREKSSEFQDSIERNSGIIKTNIDDNVIKFIKTINFYKNASNKLGIKTFNTQNLEENVNENILEIKDGLDSTIVSSKPDIEYNLLFNRASKYQSAIEIIQNMPEVIDEYEKNSMLDLKNSLNLKVQGIIYKTAYSSLNEQKQNILLEKDTILNRVLGKTALKQARISNINAKIENIAKKVNAQNPTDSVGKMLIDMYECAYQYNGGVLTEQMQEMENAIRTVFTNLPNKQELGQNALAQYKKELPANKKNSLFLLGSNIQEAKRLNAETDKIKEETNVIPNVKKQDIDSKLIKTYCNFNNILNKVKQLVKADRGNDEKETQKEAVYYKI